ncbi:hypothetical protein [Pseudoalteromonas sp. JC3]|uniref:hypothetical protein n=1 Tax=Pseudoalteromonas sp. JC3 TaxID=2810196 RepID=UPI0019D02F03|nr:hypothetical protein [Pseudoalteromonas sp. JC3]MBR8842406.1 hypothetical protein [Pseudoalteromonas sp. JC3]WJE09474.1 hypothetical protein QSH61_03090 [Pseudoalteromonas sp. JC3]
MQFSNRTNYIFEKYYLAKAKEKSKQIIFHYNQCFENLKSERIEFYLSEEKIREAVHAYFIDVIKYKESHFYCEHKFPESAEMHLDEIHSKKINNEKVASLSAKWLLRYCPASFIVPEDYVPNELERKFCLGFNEMSTLSYVYNLLNLQFPEQEEIEATKCEATKLVFENTQKLLDDILYHFKFRTYDHRHFILVFSSLVRINEALHR